MFLASILCCTAGFFCRESEAVLKLVWSCYVRFKGGGFHEAGIVDLGFYSA